MKTKLLFSSFIMLIVSFSGIFAQNLIQNGGFESITETIDEENPFYFMNVDNWYKAQGTPQVWARNIFTNISNVSPHSGDVVSYMATEHKGVFGNYCSEGIFQNVDLLECKVYTISFWVRNPSDRTLTDFYIAAANGLYNNSNDFCNIPPAVTDTMVIYHGENLAPGGWHYITTTFSPNKDYDQLWIYPRHTT